MTEGFFPLTIKKLVRETADATTIYFEVPDNLKDTFSYSAGQYLTFEVEIAGEKVRRSYSLCTYAGVDADPAVTVKRVDGGKMSNYLNADLKEGDVMQVMPPMGKFTVVPDASKSVHYVLFGGGSGITPVLGIAKAVLADEPNSKVTLVYANRNPDSVIFKQVLTDMEKASNGRFKVHHNYDSAPITYFGLKGMLTADKVQSIVKSKIGGSFDQYQYFICGPGPMMEVIKDGLRNLGISGDRVNTEYFAAPTSKNAADEKPSQSTDFNGVSEVTLTVYGKTHTITCEIGRAHV